jgi:hypothetical protein
VGVAESHCLPAEDAVSQRGSRPWGTTGSVWMTPRTARVPTKNSISSNSVGALPSHPRAVERGTPRSVAMVGIPGALDEIPKPVVVALLRAPRGRHGDDHRPFARAAQLLKDMADRPPT